MNLSQMIQDEKIEMIRTAYIELSEKQGEPPSQLSEAQLNHFLYWLEKGVPCELIGEAIRRTINKVGFLNWNYADAIIKAWHEKRLISLRMVWEDDKRIMRERRKAKRKRRQKSKAEKDDSIPGQLAFLDIDMTIGEKPRK